MKETKNARHLTYFDFNLSVTPEGQEEWLQITQVNHIGRTDKEIVQKIIRLNPEKQRILYEMLRDKFEPGDSIGRGRADKFTRLADGSFIKEEEK